jgi:acyl-CoA dehydrogenase
LYIVVPTPALTKSSCQQVYGAMGLTPDTPLAFLWSWGRALQFIDGPDEVHLRGIARTEVRHQEANRIDAARYLTPPDGPA